MRIATHPAATPAAATRPAATPAAATRPAATPAAATRPAATHPAADPHRRAIAWISTHGVEVVRWPTGVRAERDPSHRGAVRPVDGLDPGDEIEHPILFLLDPGEVAPPSWGPLQDWVRLPAESSELYDRADRLLARSEELGSSRTTIDDDGIFRAGRQLVALSPLEATLIRALLGQAGSLVVRSELEAKLWPDGPPTDPRALDNRLKRLRKRIEGLPVRIHTVRGRGFLLERTHRLPVPIPTSTESVLSTPAPTAAPAA